MWRDQEWGNKAIRVSVLRWFCTWIMKLSLSEKQIWTRSIILGEMVLSEFPIHVTAILHYHQPKSNLFKIHCESKYPCIFVCSDYRKKTLSKHSKKKLWMLDIHCLIDMFQKLRGYVKQVLFQVWLHWNFFKARLIKFVEKGAPGFRGLMEMLKRSAFRERGRTRSKIEIKFSSISNSEWLKSMDKREKMHFCLGSTWLHCISVFSGCWKYIDH